MPRARGARRQPRAAGGRGPAVTGSGGCPLPTGHGAPGTNACAEVDRMDRLWTDPRFPGVAARRATPGDLPALRAIRSRMEHDYLPEVLEQWMAEEPGGVYVYLCDGQVCGLASIHFPRPGEAWLRGKRIAVGFEGRGIGTATAFFEIEEAAGLGARVVRLMTHADNVPVHRMMERVGMRPVARWRVVEALPAGRAGAAARGGDAPDPGAGGPGVPLPVPALAELLEVGRGATSLIAAPYDPWVLHGLDAALLADLVRSGQVRSSGGPPAAVVHARHGGLLLIQRAAGDPGGAAELVRQVVARAGAEGLEVMASLPDAEAPAALAALGLPEAAGETFVVYERRLEGNPPPPGP